MNKCIAYLHIAQRTHCTLHTNLHNAQCWMWRINCPLQIANSTLNIAYYTWLQFFIPGDCTMYSEHNARCGGWIAHCLLQIADSTLHIGSYRWLHIAQCTTLTMRDATDGLPIVPRTTHSSPGLSLAPPQNIHDLSIFRFPLCRCLWTVKPMTNSFQTSTCWMRRMDCLLCLRRPTLHLRFHSAFNCTRPKYSWSICFSTTSFLLTST